MIWFLMVVGLLSLAWFLFAPRRFQTLENVPSVVDEKFRALGTVETTEDPREVRPIAKAAARAAGDRPAPGHGDSLTRDWPSEPREAHGPALAQSPQQDRGAPTTGAAQGQAAQGQTEPPGSPGH